MVLSAIIATFLNTGAIIFGIILLTKSQNKTAKWYGVFSIAATGGFFVSILKIFFLRPNPDSLFLQLMVYLLAILGFRFMPYLYLMANLTYSNLLDDVNRKKVAYYLLIPIGVLFIIDFLNPNIITVKNIHRNDLFWLTTIQGVTYVLAGYALCILPLFSKNNKLKKTVIAIINFSIVPLTLTIYNVLHIADQEVWELIILVFWAYFLVFAFLVWKFKILGFRIKIDIIENEELNKLIVQSQISEAEKEVLLLKLQGKKNQEIAEIRSVSVSTVKSQNNEILKKLNIKNFNALIKMLKYSN